MEVALRKKFVSVSARYGLFFGIGVAVMAVGAGFLAYGLTQNSKEKGSGKDFVRSGIIMAVGGTLLAVLSVGVCVLASLWILIKYQWQDEIVPQIPTTDTK